MHLQKYINLIPTWTMKITLTCLILIVTMKMKICVFYENLGNINKSVDNAQLFDSHQSSETITFSSYLSICNDYARIKFLLI